MNTENNEKKKILSPDLLKKKPGLLICLFCLCAGLLMIAFSGAGEKKAGGAAEYDACADEALNRYNEQFIAQTEAKLTEFISQIDGVGSAQVFVTLETGVQYIYATQEKQSGDSSYSDGGAGSRKSSSETSLTIIDGEKGETPVLLKRIEPSVLGVVVACDGAGDPAVREAVTQAVKTLCGIGANRVSVTQKTQ